MIKFFAKWMTDKWNTIGFNHDGISFIFKSFVDDGLYSDMFDGKHLFVQNADWKNIIFADCKRGLRTW